MKFIKIALVLLVFPLLSSFSVHKFYVSITKVEYIKEESSLQIITKIFIEDAEKTLRERYDPNIHLASEKETSADEKYLTEYIFQKLKIKVNGESVEMNYIGKEYETDIVKSFFEIKDLSEVETIEIENKVLMDMYPEQQNIIHFKNKKVRKSLMLDADNPNGLLNLN